MPLNEGWVPVKARRLQDWQKLKKYVPVHKQGDVCPNGVPALPEKGNADDDSDSEEKWMNGAVPFLCALSNVLCYAEKCPPPPTHTFLKWRFLANFKK